MIVAYAAKPTSAAKAASGRRMERNTVEYSLTYLYKLVLRKGPAKTKFHDRRSDYLLYLRHAR